MYCLFLANNIILQICVISASERLRSVRALFVCWIYNILLLSLKTANSCDPYHTTPAFRFIVSARVLLRSINTSSANLTGHIWCIWRRTNFCVWGTSSIRKVHMNETFFALQGRIFMINILCSTSLYCKQVATWYLPHFILCYHELIVRCLRHVNMFSWSYCICRLLLTKFA